MKFPPAKPRQGKRLPRGSFSRLRSSNTDKHRRRRLVGFGCIGHWLLWGGMGLLLGQRLRSWGQPSPLQWWRVVPVSGSEGSLPSGQPELPLYHWFADGLVPWLAQGTGIPAGELLRIFSVMACLAILLLCWSWGNFWSAGLWGLSPWVLTQGLEPGSEILSTWVWLCSCGVGPGSALRRWGLALACALSYKIWPLALLWAGLWTSQQWSRQPLRSRGALWLLLLLLVMALSWLGRVDLPADPSARVAYRLSSQGGLAVLATLMLPLGLSLVRLGWPWAERQQALLSLAGLGHVLWMGMLATWFWDPQVNSLQQSARWGLVGLPFLCLSAGGVLAEIPYRGWRRVLGSLLLGSSFLLSWQSLA
ncbi:hypothetical protein [Synechococcus sp. H55.1]|uniref:hypothetical protein n=2 Tax=unclassified Synechococcus TaxID=2626047 RepID=UPI0039C01A4A